MIESIISVANQIYEDRYQEADVLLLCGSVVRGEQTETSDLDLVVLYHELPNAHRKSYTYQGWPIEAFVHDLQTLHYFFDKVDRPSGIPSLMQMVVEGIEIPARTSLSDRSKELAQEYLDLGLPVWAKQDVDKSRYTISDLLDDVRGAADGAEQQAILMKLYECFADHYFRSRQLWSGKGKWIPRRFRNLDARFADEVFAAISKALRGEGIEAFLNLVEQELAKDGGELFAGFHLDAPQHWRIKGQK